MLLLVFFSEAFPIHNLTSDVIAVTDGTRKDPDLCLHECSNQDKPSLPVAPHAMLAAGKAHSSPRSLFILIIFSILFIWKVECSHSLVHCSNAHIMARTQLLESSLLPARIDKRLSLELELRM